MVVHACLFNDNIEGLVPEGHVGHIHGQVGLGRLILILHVAENDGADVNVGHIAPAHPLQVTRQGGVATAYNIMICVLTQNFSEKTLTGTGNHSKSFADHF